MPNQALRALAWTERAAGFDSSARLSARPEVQLVVANAEMLLGAGKGPTLRAARFASALVGALEQLVADEGLLKYLRGVLWLRVVKVWAVLRCDDHSWLPPRRLAFVGGGLTATLVRTKTSGAGRKMLEFLLVASRECYMWSP